MKAWTVVGYTYRADQFCPDHIVAKVTSNPGDVHHDETPIGNAEQHLDLVARINGINRSDEHSFDSDEFPKVIFASDVSDDDICGTCGRQL